MKGDGDPPLASERKEELKTNGKEVIIKRGRTLMKSKRWDKKHK